MLEDIEKAAESLLLYDILNRDFFPLQQIFYGIPPALLLPAFFREWIGERSETDSAV